MNKTSHKPETAAGLGLATFINVPELIVTPAHMSFQNQSGDDIYCTQKVLETSPACGDSVTTNTTPSFASRAPIFDETDSENDGPIAPAQKLKRKRATNNSFALDLENGGLDGSYVSPPVAKRFQFNVNVSKGVYVGVWAHSPEETDSKKHAVYAFIDKTDKLRARVHPENKYGDELTEGFPNGPGMSMIGPKDIIYESHLQSLKHLERKEYVRIRMEAIEDEESAEDRSDAEKQAVLDAVEAVKAFQETDNSAEEALTTVPEPSIRNNSSYTPKNKSSTIRKQRLKGALLGYWKDSPIAEEADRHAAYGTAQDDGKFRVRIVKETRDGRPTSAFFPTGPGAVWIAFDDVVLEPHLAHVTRTEVREYARLMQQENLEDMSDSQRKAAERDALTKATATIMDDAQALGVDYRKLDAQREANRRYQNATRKVAKSGADVVSDTSSVEDNQGVLLTSETGSVSNRRVSQPTRKKRDYDAEVTRSPASRLIPSKRNYDATTTRSSTSEHASEKGTSEAAETRSLTSQLTPKKLHCEAAVANSSTPEHTKAEATLPKAKAVRSSKDNDNTRAERLRKEKEGQLSKAAALARREFDAAMSREDSGEHMSKQRVSSSVEKSGDDVTSNEGLGTRTIEIGTPFPLKMIGEDATRNGDQANNPMYLHTLSPAEMIKDFREERENKEGTQDVSGQDVANESKMHNGAKFERQSAGPFAGALVGSKKDIINIDGEDYVKYQVLMRLRF